jgi:peptide/nickel transport system permease protein
MTLAQGAKALEATEPPPPAAANEGAMGAARRPRLGWTFWICAAWLGAIIGCAAGASVLPLDPLAIDIANRSRAPDAEFWLGSDALGRDMLARVVYGARVSLTVAFCTALIGSVFGTFFGLLAGYFRGRVEALIVGGADIGLAFPGIIILLLVAAYAGASLLNLILSIGILTIPFFTRVARATTLTFAHREFVVAARALGASHSRIIARELLPNVALPVAVVALIVMSRIIVLEGALSFLGLGVPPPAPTWGNMINAGVSELAFNPHISFVPSAVMVVTIFALNSVSNTLRKSTDLRETAL